MSHINNSEVIISTESGSNATIGVITLNRANSLNALNYAMIEIITAALLKWKDDPSIAAVVIKGNGERSFCAGGDIKSLYAMGKSDPKTCMQFFYHEYRLNSLIKYYPKPYISLIHGITMGGGIGVSLHGSHVVAAQNLILAMPESGIGFFTDVGGSYFLSRCPKFSGYYLALTGEKINCLDAKYIGLIDYITQNENSDENFNSIIEQLTSIKFTDNYSENSTLIHSLLSKLCLKDPSITEVKPQLSNKIIDNILNIEDIFNAKNVNEIFAKLNKQNNDWSDTILKILKNKSPTSLLVIFKLLQKGANMDFNDCMQMEYNVAFGFLNNRDFYEGVRAVVIDKDNKPNWDLVSVHDTSNFSYDSYFNESDAPALNFVT